MRIAVTGAAGFIGSHLVDRLLKDGNTVIGLDSLVTGSMENLEHLKSNPNFTYQQCDVTKYIGIEGPLQRVYHLASPASPKDFPRMPVHICKVGALGTLNALGLCNAKGARLLLASTSEVYGDPEQHPQAESYYGHVNSIGPRSMYDEAKRFAEALTMAYHNQNGLDTRIIRIFNTYGPRMRLNDGRVLPNFVCAAFRNEPLVLNGDGSQTRSFCYVDDLVEGMTRLMESKVTEPVNVGNPEEITIGDLAREIVALTGSKSVLATTAMPKDDPVRRRPDITRAKNVLGWEPRIHRREGLQLTIADFRRRFDASR